MLYIHASVYSCGCVMHVYMYIVREEEKRRLMRRNNELTKECAHLKEEDQRLNKSLLVQFMFHYLNTAEAQQPCIFYWDTGLAMVKKCSYKKKKKKRQI